MRIILLLVAASLGCHHCPKPPACPIVVSEPVRVVAGAPDCLTQPPQKIPPIVDELAHLAKDVAPSRQQADELADFTIAITKYAYRAWRLCGKVPTP